MQKDAGLPAWTWPVLLALVVALGLGLRLEDPLSSPTMAAEDPYTHVVFAKEHVRRGYFDDVFVLGTSLYPPGLHAFSGIFAPLAGVELYDFARVSPAFFGAFGVLGMALLANRLGGPAAGLAAGLLVAVLPEHIVRTNVFFPTMVDMALLPAFFLLFLLALRGSWAAGGFLLLVSVVLAYTHPWVVPLAAGIAAAYAALRVLRERGFTDGDAAGGSFAGRVRRVAPAAGLLSVSVALAAVARWDHGNTGFVDFLADAGPLSVLAGLRLPDPLLFVVLTLLTFVLAAGLVAALAALAGALARVPSRARAVGAWALGIGLVALAWSVGQDPPVNVFYDEMLGHVPIALALLGVVLAMGRPTPLGDLALTWSALMFPLAGIQIFTNVFDAQHWPSRAMVYLGLGVALLGAVSVSFAVREATRMLAARRGARWVVPTATLTAVFLVAGAVAASPAEAEPWYRLYEDHEFEAFEETSRMLAQDPQMRVVVPNWQSGLILKALGDPFQVRYGPKFFNDTVERQEILDEAPDRPTYVLVDRFLIERMQEEPERGIDISFLESGEYHLVHRTTDDNYRLYRYAG